MAKTGVFVCWCGSNIAATVDVEKVAKKALEMEGVFFSLDYKYMCSEPGQEIIKNAIIENKLDRIVVAACSPRMHETTFRKALESAGLNSYMLEMANIREHCSWVHSDKEKGTEKAIDIVKMAVAKVNRHKPLTKSTFNVNKKALVLGGGIAGIQSALDIADAGFEVVLVEKEPSIGGKMAQIDKTFPTLDCSACILTPKMVDASRHENIKLHTYSEIEKVEGFVGNFTVTIKKKARYVDMNKCTGCGICLSKCPSKVSSEFDIGLGVTGAIYTPFPQAVPNKPVIDSVNCKYLQSGKCGVCKKVCPTGAILFEDKDEIIKEEVGAIVVATGYDLFDHSVYGEYGGGRYKDVLTAMQFERLVNASGPSNGKIKRPSDGKSPKNIVFIKCVGSRDEAKGKSYCSKTCCMYTAKQAILMKEKYPDSQSYVFYMDARCAGKNYEEFYQRATQEYGVKYIRGRVSKIYPKGDKLVVKGEDSLVGKQVEVDADLVVLATAMISQSDASKIAQTLSFSYDNNNFFTEAHPKLKPVETNTAGIFLAGACQGPKDIPDTVSQASAAAAKACILFCKGKIESNPQVTEIDSSKCSGCMLCKPICPYGAIDSEIVLDRCNGKQIERKIAKVNEGLCQGCGACTVACRSGALNLKGFSNEQIMAEVEALWT